MIKFFRKIRQGLLTENKFSKYFLYAIGEIVLVMIGILLALQVNNLNENRKKRNTEHSYLIALKEEVKFNKSELEKVMEKNKNNEEKALKLSTYMGLVNSQTSEKEFAKLFFTTIVDEVQYRPSQGVIDEIISSGKLEIFTNAELRFALTSWNGILFKVRFQEQEHSRTRRRMADILIAEGNVRKAIFDSYGEVDGIEQNKFKLGNFHLSQSEELDNQLIAFIMTARFLNENYYSDLEKVIEELLLLIDKELK